MEADTQKVDTLQDFLKPNETIYRGSSHFVIFGYHEMRGLRIPRTLLSIKLQNGSKKILKTTFCAKFQFLKIKIQLFVDFDMFIKLFIAYFHFL
jgi:hypothetical protein